MTPKKKSVWVLAMAGVSYNDDFHHPSPDVEVLAVGTYKECMEALKKSIPEEASAYWEGADDSENSIQSEIDEVMASREDYSPSIKEWEMYHSSQIIVWRLHRKTQK